MKGGAERGSSGSCQNSPASPEIAISQVRFCTARSDTEAADEAGYLAACGGIVAVEYLSCSGELRCRSGSLDIAQLGAESPATAGQQQESGSRHDQRDGAPGERPALFQFATVDPSTNDFLYVRLFPKRTTVLTNLFVCELKQKHDVVDRLFFFDCAPWLKAALFDAHLRF